MTNFGFIITHDMLDPSIENAEGFTFGDTSRFDLNNPRDNKAGHLFRLYDDDDNLYFKGRLIYPGDNPEEIHLTAPLFKFGAGYGCTKIKFQGKPKWTIA